MRRPDQSSNAGNLEEVVGRRRLLFGYFLLAKQKKVTCRRAPPGSELGEPRSKESEQVMYACHELLQAAKKSMLDSILGNKTITDGTRWVNLHPKVVPYIQDVEEARQDASQLKD